MCVCMCRYFCVYVSLLRGKHRDHIVPLRVNIPSQVILISLERKGEKKKEKKDYYKRQEGKKGNCKKKKRKEVPRKCERLKIQRDKSSDANTGTTNEGN